MIKPIEKTAAFFIVIGVAGVSVSAVTCAILGADMETAAPVVGFTAVLMAIMGVFVYWLNNKF